MEGVQAHSAETLPEGVVFVFGPLDGFRDFVPAANILQHTQHGLIGTTMGRAP